MSAPQGLPGIIIAIILGIVGLSIYKETGSILYAWLTVCGLGILIIVISWYLWFQRSYKEIDKKVYLREGRLGKWKELMEHLRKEHPIEYNSIKEDKKK